MKTFNVCFFYRAAMKMANIDAVFDFMFSEKVMQQKVLMYVGHM